MAQHRVSLQSRFWRKVERGDDCWSWSGAHKQGGVPVLNVGGRVRPAHRIAWQLAFGAPEETLPIFHRCGNKACVRPDHLTQDAAMARRLPRKPTRQSIPVIPDRRPDQRGCSERLLENDSHSISPSPAP